MNTAKGVRVNFPKAQSRIFCDELGEVLNAVKRSESNVGDKD